MAIAVDPVAGFLFWADRGRVPKIERARLDGSGRRLLVNETIFFPSGLTLDYQNKRVYWCDSRLDTIERIDYDGKNRVMLLDNKALLENPQGIAIHQGNLYWIDTTLHGGALNQAPVSNVSNISPVLTQLGESLKDVKVIILDFTAMPCNIYLLMSFVGADIQSRSPERIQRLFHRERGM